MPPYENILEEWQIFWHSLGLITVLSKYKQYLWIPFVEKKHKRIYKDHSEKLWVDVIRVRGNMTISDIDYLKRSYAVES